ncbi:hypothetical protein T265_12198 [Opisthorchis viverrini]|uniref:Uncharacterized protein n=1 Tax=Opisthorchis viverrini TaxID=6198 RepID=A0A074Z616_OPIVI|nr:hypothetical protein T265_12198 [Opisthorchis viverrini]KER18665.1 hypothetical protein T265_12198 [Opisthorchis viverrini]
MVPLLRVILGDMAHSEVSQTRGAALKFMTVEISDREAKDVNKEVVFGKPSERDSTSDPNAGLNCVNI